MDKIAFLFEPSNFYSLLAGLFGISIFVIYFLIRKSKVEDRAIDVEEMRIEELESLVAQKESEYNRKVTDLESTLRNKGEEHEKQIKELEDRLKGKEQLRNDVKNREEELNKKIKELEIQLKDKQNLEAVLSKVEAQLKEAGESNKKLKELQDNTARLSKDLSVKEQMYNGIKNQYDELEKDYMKLKQQLEEEKGHNPQKPPGSKNLQEPLKTTAQPQSKTEGTKESSSVPDTGPESK